MVQELTRGDGRDSARTRSVLHMIGNAHIDPVWLWQWQEGFHEVKATFRSALDRMNEYPEFIFVASSAAFYEWVEKSDPAMFTEIQRRVAEGRWQIVGGWWVEPDCNIPGGESFVRHGLYGQRYFRQKFGKMARVGFNIDTFGHAGTLPQILKKSGLPYYVFLRPMPHEKSLPSRLFWWESGDGSRVMAFRIPFEYLSWGKELDSHVRRCADEMKNAHDEFMCFYGVGNHGGGPTIENLESIRRLNQQDDTPELVPSSPEAFFHSVEAKGWSLPVVYSDLRNQAAGCYAAHSGVKRWNRQAENRLVAAEKWSLLAQWTNGQPYPSDFAHAWKNVLFNQFHDILAGTSLEAAYEDARSTYGEALAIADRNLNYAVQSFAWNICIKPEEGSRPIIVFNSHAWPVQANVEIDMPRWSPTAVLLDDRDQIVPHQEVQPLTTTGRARLSFMADLPALGYRTYRLMPQGAAADHPCVEASNTVMENVRFRLEFDLQTGCITRLFDKLAQVDVFDGEAAKPVVLDDPSDTWGHNMAHLSQVVGAFQATSVQRVAHGPVKSVIRVTSEYGKSTLIQDFTMYPDRDLIDVRVIVDWREHLKLLKLRFPVRVKFMKVTHETAYGHMEQTAVGDEIPVHGWVDMTGTSRDREVTYGFSLLNDSKYSMDVNVRDIGLTVLRSPAYANHSPSVLEPGALYSFMDQGIQEFHYTMLPHTGSWEQVGTVKRAAELNQPPIILIGTYHAQGTLPQSDSFIDVEPDHVMVTVLKQAEDGDDLILRAYETIRTASRASIRLPRWNRSIESHFGPGEIRTFRIPRDPSAPATETDLLEF